MALLEEEWPHTAASYSLEKSIGRGASAEVWKATCLPLKRAVAVKVLDLETCPIDIETIRKEVAFMKSCEHPNIISYYCSFAEGSNLWLVMKFMSGGSIADIMKFSYPNGLVDEPLIATILKGALKGLQYLHSSGSLHRDVKGGNILLSETGEIELCDFGVAASIFEGANLGTRVTFVGTPHWMAPEVMEQIGYDSRADIWSFGITAIELAEGKPPHSGLRPMAVVQNVLKGQAPELSNLKSWSKHFKDLVSVCLRKDPAQRPTALKLLDHKFFKLSKKNEYVTTKLFDRLPPLEKRISASQRLGQSLVSRPKDVPKEAPKAMSGSWIFEEDEIVPPEANVTSTTKGRFTVKAKEDSSRTVSVSPLRQSSEQRGRFRVTDKSTDGKVSKGRFKVKEISTKDKKEKKEKSKSKTAAGLEQFAESAATPEPNKRLSTQLGRFRVSSPARSTSAKDLT